MEAKDQTRKGKMSTISELSAKPAGEDQIARGREIIGNSPDLKAQLDAFLASGPTRGQMLDFLSLMRSAASEEQLRQKIESICRVVGIERPSNTDRLMAMQIGLMQEQNAILQSGLTRTLNQMRADAKESDSGSAFTALIGGVMLGVILS